MAYRTPRAVKPKPYSHRTLTPASSRSSLLRQGTLINALDRTLEIDRLTLRFDANITREGHPKVGYYLTADELQALLDNSPGLSFGGTCRICGLEVGPWGFCEYFFNEEENAVNYDTSICKACWKYSPLNPLFDDEVDSTVAPPVR